MRRVGYYYLRSTAIIRLAKASLSAITDTK
jgi:hypothetical protein